MKSEIYIYPTDTVWGIGGSAYSLESYQKVSKAKNTALNKPLSILFSSTDQLKEHLDLSDKFLELFQEVYELGFSAGVNKDLLIKPVPDSPFENTKYICFRLLENNIMQGLKEIIDFPITTTSLNLSGQDPIVSLEKAKDFWQKHIPEAKFIEGINTKDLSGKASTIVLFSLTSFKVVREGENVERILSIIEDYGYKRS